MNKVKGFISGISGPVVFAKGNTGLRMLEMVYVLSFWVPGKTSNLEPGWSSLMFVILIVGGILMILLGFIGVYVGYIFQEVKHRPVYLVKRENDKSE